MRATPEQVVPNALSYDCGTINHDCIPNSLGSCCLESGYSPLSNEVDMACDQSVEQLCVEESGHIDQTDKKPEEVSVSAGGSRSGEATDMEDLVVNFTNLNPEELFVMPIRLTSSTELALIDTGASSSMIKSSSVDSSWAIDHTINDPITGFGGSRVIPLGSVEARFQLGSVNLEGHFLVVPDHVIKHSIILGSDFFMTYNITIDFKRKQISGNTEEGQWDVIQCDDEIHTLFRNVPVYADTKVSIHMAAPALVPICVSSIIGNDTPSEMYYDGGS